MSFLRPNHGTTHRLIQSGRTVPWTFSILLRIRIIWTSTVPYLYFCVKKVSGAISLLKSCKNIIRDALHRSWVLEQAVQSAGAVCDQTLPQELASNMATPALDC